MAPTTPQSGAVGAGAICVLPDEPSVQFDTARSKGLHEEIKMEVVSVVKWAKKGRQFPHSYRYAILTKLARDTLEDRN